MFQNEVLIQSMDLAMEMIVFFRENGQILYANHLAYQLLEYQDKYILNSFSMNIQTYYLYKKLDLYYFL